MRAATAAALGLLRRTALAPITPREAFVCRRCLHKQAPSLPPTFRALRDTAFLRAFKSRSLSRTTTARTASSHAVVPPSGASPLGNLSHTLSVRAANASSKTRTSSFPETSSNSVAYWLLGSAASVFGLVIFGGLTRLTESGLSITEWRPITGSKPPTTAQEWESEFALYRASPEFKQLNSRMTLAEFKQIYWMEWIHRLWGRIVGITFLLPTAYFIARRRVSSRMAVRLVGICGLIGFQGVIGWWMVKSGLKDDLFAPGSVPRVSQYRLTAHLGTAFVCYLAMFWNALAILRANRLLALNPAAASATLDAIAGPGLRTFRRSVAGLALLVFATAMSGGLVAGLDAGLIYNEFPYMGLGLVPPVNELLDPFYSHVADRSDLWWRNMLENPVLVQLDHRVMATSTFSAIMALWAYARYNPRVRALLSRPAGRALNAVVALAWLQVTLGISTLLYLVPLPLASAHQAGALALLTGTLFLGSRVWVPSRLVAQVQRLQAVASNSAARGVTRPGGGATLKHVPPVVA